MTLPCRAPECAGVIPWYLDALVLPTAYNLYADENSTCPVPPALTDAILGGEKAEDAVWGTLDVDRLRRDCAASKPRP